MARVRWAPTVTPDRWRTVQVTARLQAGAALPAMFPAPLDGLLAAVVHRDALDRAYGHQADHHVARLPLATDVYGANRNQCVWAATCATPLDSHGDEVHWWHRRFDADTAMRHGHTLADQALNGSVGRYRGWRVPLVVTTCAALRWTAVGCPDAIDALMAGVVAVGKKRSMGEGAVIGHTVTEIGPVDMAAVRWVDGLVARPYPLRAAHTLGLDSPATVAHTYRPPYWRAPQTARPGGGFGRALPEVIAPWTTTPSVSTAV